MLLAKFLRINVVPLAVSCGIALSTFAASAQTQGTAVKPDSAAEKGSVLNSKNGAADGASHNAVVGIPGDAKTFIDAKANAKSAVSNDSADGAKSEGSKLDDTDITNGGGSETKSAADGTKAGTTTGITAQEITPLDADEEEDPYAAYNKQQMALFQQHEAVQHYNAAQYYMKKWDNELAELELRAAIMYMPELKIAHRDYCIVAILRGKLLRAIAEFCMVFGIGEPLPFTAEQQQALRTEASQAHYKRGLELATKGDWDESISELMWARTYLPNDPAVHRSLAFAYASKGDFKMAEQYYQSTFSIDPNDAFAHADFAYLLSQKGKKDEAVSEMAKAVKADPDSTALHVDLGWLAESKGDLNTAENEFRAALNRAPQYGQLWFHLGQILEHRHKTSDAITAYKTAIEKEPSNEQAAKALARLGSPTTSAASATTDLANQTKLEQAATLSKSESAGNDASATKAATVSAKDDTASGVSIQKIPGEAVSALKPGSTGEASTAKKPGEAVSALKPGSTGEASTAKKPGEAVSVLKPGAPISAATDKKSGEVVTASKHITPLHKSAVPTPSPVR